MPDQIGPVGRGLSGTIKGVETVTTWHRKEVATCILHTLRPNIYFIGINFRDFTNFFGVRESLYTRES